MRCPVCFQPWRKWITRLMSTLPPDTLSDNLRLR